MKKLLAVILAMIMVLAVNISAFAANEVTITLPENGHTYKIYQIFTGDIDIDGNELSNIKWGKDGTGETGKGVAADTLAAIVGITGSNAAKGTAIKAYVAANAEGTEVESTKDKNAVEVAPGYYLIEDVTKLAKDADDFISLYLVEVCGNVTVAPKGDKPQVEKKVKDINDSTDATASDWQDSADYDIGDDVPFQLTATMPSPVDGYETYKVVFHDTLSDGLTFNNDITVTIGNTTYKADDFETKGISVATTTKGFDVTINDVLKLGATASSKIVVEYTAKLTGENVQFGSAGNSNKVSLEYSNNPYAEGTGMTPEDEVIVFTYKVVVNKVDESGTPLKGAGFTLYKQTGTKTVGEGENATTEPVWEAVGEEVKGTDMTTFEWKGLDDGIYKLSETTTPANYNTLDDQIFTVTAEHKDGATPSLETLTGTVTTGEITFDNTNCVLTSTVVNQSGALLPETGGIGTTIFYICGSILVLGAAVLLITKKRVNAEK